MGVRSTVIWEEAKGGQKGHLSKRELAQRHQGTEQEYPALAREIVLGSVSTEPTRVHWAHLPCVDAEQAIQVLVVPVVRSPWWILDAVQDVCELYASLEGQVGKEQEEALLRVEALEEARAVLQSILGVHIGHQDCA